MERARIDDYAMVRLDMPHVIGDLLWDIEMAAGVDGVPNPQVRRLCNILRAAIRQEYGPALPPPTEAFIDGHLARLAAEAS